MGHSVLVLKGRSSENTSNQRVRKGNLRVAKMRYLEKVGVALKLHYFCGTLIALLSSFLRRVGQESRTERAGLAMVR